MQLDVTRIADSSSIASDHSWYPLVSEIAVPFLIFLGIIVIAVVLGKFIGWAEKRGLSRFSVTVLRGVEQIVFLVDALVFIFYVAVKGFESVRNLLA